ncbi:MAG: glycogen synthase [Bacteroidales bacterium]|nr:MAG: glycogen synthase [Bacteroidales bacterium]
METIKILYICQEIFPYTAETFASQLCRELPQFAQENGNYEVRVFMPCFGNINERRNQLHEVQRLSGLNLIVDDNDHQLIIKVASIQSARIQIYFIDNETYFKRKAMYVDDNGESFKDNDERMIFFTRGVLETIKKLRWTPDIIHCNGFLTALSPLYIKTMYASDPFFAESKVVFSVYNDKFTNELNNQIEKKLGIKEIKGTKVIKDKKVTWETITKLACDYSDTVCIGEEGADDLIKGIQIDTPIEHYTKDLKKSYLEVYNKISQLNK